MNILHIAPITFKKSSGVSTVVPEIIQNQNKIDGVNSALLNCSKVDSKTLEIEKEKFDFKMFDNKYCYPFDLDRLESPFDKPDIVIIHNTYFIVYKKISKYLMRNNIPYILVPHGSMTEEAQNIKKRKKIIGNLTFFNQLVKGATRIQYLSEGEAQNSKKWNKKFITIGNGVDSPEYYNTKKIKQNPGQINLNFIGRLDINYKGLDNLLKASLYAKDILKENKATINLYGPDQDENQLKIENFIADNQLNDVVCLKGPVYGNDKQEVYLDTDIFILPSRSEGLPTAVLEALSYGVPCLLTPGTNMANEVEKYECGWKTEANPDDIAIKIKFILEDFSDFGKFKNNARSLIEKKYSWKSISEIAIQEYRKLI